MRPLYLFTASFFSATTAFASGETEISFDDVPAIVMETVIATAPALDFHRVSTEIENGVLVYEFEATTFDGKHVEIDVLEDGTLAEIEMETSQDETPAAVTEALFEAYPDFEISYIEASTREDWSMIYEIEGKTAEGNEITLEIAEDGKILSVTENALS